jgi:hypothetical protein
VVGCHSPDDPNDHPSTRTTTRAAESRRVGSVMLIMVLMMLVMLLQGRLQREWTIMMLVKFVGYRYAGVIAVAAGWACRMGWELSSRAAIASSTAASTKCPGVMHAMTMTLMLAAMEGRVRLTLDKHGRQLCEWG